MAILKIYTFPDPVLKQKAEPVEAFDEQLAKLAADMLDTMYDAPGVGLAANQVGVLQRIAVIDVDYDVEGEEEGIRKYVNQNPRVLVNPEVVTRKGEFLFKEGCLSVPGYSEEVKRAEEIEIRYQDLQGQPQTLQGNALLAVAIQHEIDHLDGKLFIDRLSLAKRSLIKGKIKKDRNTAQFERSRFHVEL
ncbi:MAG: peptide deformylase [Bdellovibrionota bacterium]